MPSYLYRCPDEHTIERTFASFRDRASRIRCRCGRWASYSVAATIAATRVNALPDLPEHFNDSLGMVLKSRRHLRDVVARSQDTDTPIAPYERVMKQSSDWTEKPNRPPELPRMDRQTERMVREQMQRSGRI